MAGGRRIAGRTSLRTRAACLAACLALVACRRGPDENLLRFAYFPNVTHVQPLAGLPSGELTAHLPPGVRVETRLFSAGPALVQALLADEVDIGYVGPGPAVNGYLRSQGRALRVVAGASSGGAVFVVRREAGIASPEDLHGRRLATPQLGNTQDVALRRWLADRGLVPDTEGGDVRIVPTGYPEMPGLFLRGQVDGAWVAEPWGARLELEFGARLFLDERDLWPDGRFATGLVVAGRRVLERRPELVRAFLRGHVAVTRRLAAAPDRGATEISRELKRLTGQGLSPQVVALALSRTEPTWDPLRASVVELARAQKRLGFVESDDVSGLFDDRFLREALAPAHPAARRP